jgi:thiol:disulfide interchange protein DsbC
MKVNMKKLITIVLLLFSASVVASGVPNELGIDGFVNLPIKSLKAIEKNGVIYYVSERGRYIIQGQMIDVWHKKPLDTLKEIKYSANHIKLDVMGMPIDQLNTITIPGGPKKVVAFVDPKCKNCKKFIEEAELKSSRYTFKIIVVPALGEDSNRLAKKLFCAKDKTKALYLLKEQRLDELVAKENCDTKLYDKTLFLAEMLKIRAVPYFFSPTGRTVAGMKDDFWDWLEYE